MNKLIRDLELERFALTLVLLLAACGPGLQSQPYLGQQPVPVAGPQTWIDAPLQDATIPQAPYEIIVHAAYPAGIPQFELTINGDDPVKLMLPASQWHKRLVYFQHEWTPPAPGIYVIHVRAATGLLNIPNGLTYGQTVEVQVHVVGVLAALPTVTVPIAAYQPPCIWTADLNVFVRRGPGSSNYDEVDEMVKGDSAPVVGESEDGQFWAVESSPGVVGYVPKAERFGHADGDCAKPKFTPPPTRVPSKTPNLVPQCSDGIDNDGDGRIDFGGTGGDLQCRNAADNDESTP